MSTLERALQKLAKADSEDSQKPREPIAQVVRRSMQPQHVEAHGIEGAARVVQQGRHVTFDLDGLTAAGLLSSENSLLAEQFRSIKQPILAKASELAGERGENGNLILVTSSLAGEGKTFSCVNLSLSLAREKDWEVVLVDVDCKNPQLSRLLGVYDEPGLMELLRDPGADLESFILPTSISGLSVLPLGQRDEHAAELLASARMRQLCSTFCDDHPHRLTIFDTSPLLLTTEPTILARLVGQIVMVVQSGRTPQHAVRAAVGRLDHNKAIGLILNRANESAVGSGYGTYGAYPYHPSATPPG